MNKDQNELLELMKIDRIPSEEVRYEVPDNWIWTELQYVSEVIGGGTPKSKVLEYYKDGNIPWITPADLSGYKDIYISQGKKNITELGLTKSSAKFIPAGSVLLSSRAPIGYVAIAKNVVTTNQGFKSFVPSKMLDAKYLYWYLISSKGYLESIASGSTFKEVSATKCKNIQIPLPTITVQKKIANRVDNFFIKINEAKRLIREAKETFEHRRHAILDKAVTGELTVQWREKNPITIKSNDLFENITSAKYNSESGIKTNTNKILGVSKKEKSFELPESWKWVKLGELAYYITSGSREWSKYYSDSGALFVRTQDIKTNNLVLNNAAHVNLPEKVEGKRSLVQENDILTTITGANVGKCALIDEAIPEAYVSQSVALTKLVDKRISKYVHLALISTKGGGGELKNRAYGIGRPVLSLEDIKNIKIPLPPLEEQKEIVKQVEFLLSNEINAFRMINLDEELDDLSNSILNKAFRGEL